MGFRFEGTLRRRLTVKQVGELPTLAPSKRLTVKSVVVVAAAFEFITVSPFSNHFLANIY